MLRDVHQEVDMVQGKAEVAELKPEAFQVMERLDADINVDLFSKTVISVVGDKHHGHPVIAGVTRNLFRATANYNVIHKFFAPVASVKGRRMPAARDKKEYSLMGEKRRCDFSSAGLSLRFRPHSILSRNYK